MSLRRWPTPTADLEERLDAATGQRRVALLLHERYHRLPALQASLEVGRSFLEQPLVPGLAPLVDADTAAGRCVYHTGAAVPLTVVLEGGAAGPRAAAELGALLTAILTEGAEAGELAGVFCHGDVSPGRVLLGPEGDVCVVGYGVPEVEHWRMRHTGADRPLADTFGWAPPERLIGRPEDVRSDLYSAALLVAAVATGVSPRPGPVQASYDAAHAGRFTFDHAAYAALPPAMLRQLTRMLDPSPRQRPGPSTWQAGWVHLLDGGLPGPSLADVAHAAHRHQEHQPTSRRASDASESSVTRVLALATLRRMLERELAVVEEAPLVDAAPPPSPPAPAPAPGRQPVASPPTLPTLGADTRPGRIDAALVDPATPLPVADPHQRPARASAPSRAHDAPAAAPAVPEHAVPAAPRRVEAPAPATPDVPALPRRLDAPPPAPTRPDDAAPAAHRRVEPPAPATPDVPALPRRLDAPAAAPEHAVPAAPRRVETPGPAPAPPAPGAAPEPEPHPDAAPRTVAAPAAAPSARAAPGGDVDRAASPDATGPRRGGRPPPGRRG